MSPAPAEASRDSGTSTAQLLEWVTLIVTPFATLTGLLYYFGWVRTNAIFGYFGIDANLLAYSPQDYLLRSAGVAFRPCAAVLIGAAAALLTFRLLRHVDGPTRWRSRIVLVDVAVIGLIFLVPSIAVLFGQLRTGSPMLAAAGIVAGAVLLEFVATLWPVAAARPERALRRGTVAVTVVLGLFWSFAIYAQQTGERVAAFLATDPASMSNAVVTSKEDLGLTGFGITMTKSAGTVALPYRYCGLRLFVYRNGRWFLLPVDWRKDNGASVIVLTDSDTIRVELRPGQATVGTCQTQ